jgi:hypothetical protein
MARVGTDGRFMKCGSMAITFNWVHQKALNITQSGKASCIKDDCGSELVPGGVDDTHSETGDFWVSTIGEVNKELRCYVADRDKWDSYWTAVLSGQSATKPECGSVGLSRVKSFASAEGASILESKNALTLINNSNSPVRAKIVNANGAVVASVSAEAFSNHGIRNLVPGCYIVSLEAYNSLKTMKVLVR